MNKNYKSVTNLFEDIKPIEIKLGMRQGEVIKKPAKIL